MEKAQPRPFSGVHWQRPERQIPRTRIFKRVGLEELTPVFGSAQPPRGLSGIMRARAYAIPEHKAAHWALLLAADRVDVVEGLVVDAFTRKPFIGLWALAAGGASFIAFRALRSSRPLPRKTKNHKKS